MDFFFLERGDVNVIYKHMIQLIREKLPPFVEAGPYDIQVLTPMRKGNLGVEVLNEILQRYLNPPKISTMDISSMIITSASNGFSSFLSNQRGGSDGDGGIRRA